MMSCFVIVIKESNSYELAVPLITKRRIMKTYLAEKRKTENTFFLIGNKADFMQILSGAITHINRKLLYKNNQQNFTLN